jgi:hypothetical protein
VAAGEETGMSGQTQYPVPERTLEQRREALARANDIRSRRAELKREIKAGRVSVHELLLNPPEFIETMKVFELMMAAPKNGRVKVSQILTHTAISGSKSVGGLTERQRSELVRRLR